MTDFRRQRLVSKLCDFFGFICDDGYESYLEILHRNKPQEKLNSFHNNDSNTHNESMEMKMLLNLLHYLKQGNYIFGSEPKLKIEGIIQQNHASDDKVNKEKTFQLSQCDNLVFEPFQNVKELQIGNITISLQEILVMEDLLWILLGIKGQYFFFDFDRSIIFVDSTLTNSILEIIKANRIMNVALNHLKITLLANKSVKTVSFHTLRNYIIDYGLKEYYQVISSLEKNLSQEKLSIRQIVFHIEPFENLMSLFYDLLEASSKHEEEIQVLNFFMEWKNRPNLSHSMINLTSLEAAIFAPSLRLISNALSNDLEFLDSNLSLLFNDIVLPKHYFTMVNDILNAQKLFSSSNQSKIHLPEKFSQSNVLLSLKKIKEESDSKLLKLITVESIIKILTVLKHMYFLNHLNASFDFFIQCRKELTTKKVTDINTSRVQAFFEMAFENTISTCENDLKFKISWSKFSLLNTLTKYAIVESSDDHNYSNLSSIDAFQLDVEFYDGTGIYQKLIFKDELMAKYRLIFRLQFLLNDLIYVLIHENREEKNPKKLFLRKNAYIFIRTIKEYFGFNVLEKQWNHMIDTIKATNNINEIIKSHEGFLNSCLRECLLCNPKLIQSLFLVIKTCHAVNAPLSSEEIVALSSEYFEYCRAFIEALNYYSMRDYEFYLGMSIYSFSR